VRIRKGGFKRKQGRLSEEGGKKRIQGNCVKEKER
jgi:hypothetical protein